MQTSAEDGGVYIDFGVAGLFRAWGFGVRL